MTLTQFNKQKGSVLIITILLLSCMSLIAMTSITNTTQQTRIIYNYQQHLAALINTRLCINQLVKEFSNLSDANNWANDGLYNKESLGPMTFRNFKWTNKNSRSHNKNCRYIIEYLGRANNNTAGKHTLLRLTVKGSTKNYYKRTMQTVYLFKNSNINSTEIIFATTPILQQWTELY